MVGRNLGGVVMVALASVLAACGGDDGDAIAGAEAAVTTTTSPSEVDDETADERTWTSGEATLDLDGQRWTFDLDLCAVQPADRSPETSTVTLQVEGTVVDDPNSTLQIVETATGADEQRIQVVRVRLRRPDGGQGPWWEAQRVVTVATGEVFDVHGDGTTPLLDVDEGEDLVVTATDAAFWQFGMGTAEDRPMGAGDLRAHCG